jgi:hypothetical protein
LPNSYLLFYSLARISIVSGFVACFACLGRFDHNPTAKDILGEEGFKKLQQMVADTYETTESTLFWFNAELSNPPDAIAKAMDF